MAAPVVIPAWALLLNPAAVNKNQAIARVNPLPDVETSSLAAWVGARGSSAASISAFLFDYTGKAVSDPAGAAAPVYGDIDTGRDHGAAGAPFVGNVTVAQWMLLPAGDKAHAAYAAIRPAIEAMAVMNVARAFVDLTTSAQVKDLTTRRIRSYYASMGAEIDSDMFTNVVNYWSKIVASTVLSWGPTLLADSWGRYRLTIASSTGAIDNAMRDFPALFTLAERGAVDAYLLEPYRDPLLRMISSRTRGKAKAVLEEIGELPQNTYFLAKSRLSPAESLRIKALVRRRLILAADVAGIAALMATAAVDAQLQALA